MYPKERLIFLFSLIVVITSQCLLENDKSAVCNNQGYTTMPITFKKTITILILSNNKISSISTNEAELYPEVTELDLSYNAIESYQDIRGVSILRKLKILNLSGNRLLAMNFHVFLSRNIILEDLDISNNMNMLIKEASVNLKKLLKISLKNNKMSYLPLKAFKGFSKLETLDLANNALTNLSVNVIKMMPNLRHVYLSGNLIAKLDNSLLQISDLEDLKKEYKAAQKHNTGVNTTHLPDHSKNMNHTASTENSNSTMIETITKETSKDINKTNESHYGNGNFTSDGTQEEKSSNSASPVILYISIALGVLILAACMLYLLTRRNFSDHVYTPLRRIRDNYFRPWWNIS